MAVSELPPGFILDQPSLPAGFVLDKPSYGEDIAKSAGAGLANAAAGTLGMIGDARELGGMAGGAIADKLGIPQSARDTAFNVAKYIPGIGALATAPTSRDILNSATDPIVDPNYKPQSIAGGFIKTGAEFLPGMAMGGPRNLGQRLLTNVVAPAVTSETAGQLTKETAAEPYARTAGALIGGAAGAKLSNVMSEARALKAATPALDTLKADTSAGYNALTAGNVATPLAPAALDNLANDIRDTLNRTGKRQVNAGSIHSAIEELRTPATAGAPDLADLVASRQSIKDLLGTPDTNKAGAFIALGKIEKAIEQASPGTMRELKALDKNWGAVRASESLDKKIARADLRAAGADSGLNLGNKIRQKVADLLVSNEAKYLSADTKKELEKIVRGTWTQNGMRLVSNMLGGGGGIGSTIVGLGAAGAGQATGHPELALAAPFGLGMRMALNRSVSRQALRAGEAIRRASPAGQAALPVLPLPSNTSLAALRSALLARPRQ